MNIKFLYLFCLEKFKEKKFEYINEILIYKKSLIGVSLSIPLIIAYSYSKNRNIPEEIKKINSILEKYKNNTNINFILEEQKKNYKNKIYIEYISYTPFKDLKKVKEKDKINHKFLQEIKKFFIENKLRPIVNNIKIDLTNVNENTLNKNDVMILHSLIALEFFINDILKTFLNSPITSIEYKFSSSLKNNLSIENYKKILISACKKYNFKFIETII